MGADYERLLDQVTRHLSADRELQLEIRRELSIHLDDAAAEFAAGGRSEDEARQLAIKALGPAEELASQLYEANRRRMRWRGVLRKVALTALLPVAIVVTLWPVVDGVLHRDQETSLETFVGADRSQVMPLASVVNMLGGGIRSKIDALPEEQRFLFRGANGDLNSAAVAQSIVQRWPDNPVYWANHVTMLLFDHKEALEEAEDRQSPMLDQFQELLGAIERGRQLEPDNAWYDFLEASILLQASSRLEPKAGPEVRTLRRVPGEPDKTQVVGQRTSLLVVQEAKLFQAGLDAFRSGLRKPYSTNHAIDMMRHRLELIGPPQTMKELIGRISLSVSVLLPDQGHWRRLGNRVMHHAIVEAEQGRPKESLKQLDDLTVLSGKLAAKSGCLIELMVAQSIENLAERGRVAVFDMQGENARADAALARIETAIHWRKDAERRYGQLNQPDLEEYGVLMRVTLPAVPGYRPDPEPLRTAEYVMFEKAMITTSLVLIDLLAILLGLSAWVLVWRERRAKEKTPFVWIGWRRLGWIAAVAVAAPLSVYLIYAVSPASGRDHGLWVTGKRLLIEHALLFAVTVWLLVYLTGRAVRERAKQLGIASPSAEVRQGSKLGWQIRIAGGTLIIVIAAMFAVYLPICGVIILATMVYLAWGVAEMLVLFGRYVCFQFSPRQAASRVYIRSLSPVLAMVVIMAALIGYSVTSGMERAAIHRAGGNSGLDFIGNEINASAYAEVRDAMVKRHAELMGRMK